MDLLLTKELILRLWSRAAGTAASAARRSVGASLAWKSRHRAAATGVVAASLAAGALSLTGSSSLEQQIAADPLRRAAARAGGDLGPQGLQRISHGLSPFAVSLAERLDRSPWTPSGAVGWASYDLSHPPALVGRTLDHEEARAFNALVAPTATAIEPMEAFHLKADAGDRQRALTCLSQAVYYEAGFETGEGMQAVAQVVLNRVRHPAYPNSVCGVVYQGASRQTGCQFSFTCDGSLARVPSPEAWERSRDVARRALDGHVYAPVGASTHYHADYVFPYWAVTLVKLRQLGTHIFYRMTGPGGQPDGFTARYAGSETISAAVLTGGDSLTPDAPSIIGPANAKPAARTVTLTVGGEARTYVVAQTPAAPEQAAGALSLGSVPQLTPARRAPTAEEIAQINATLKRYEESQIEPKVAVLSAEPKIAID